MGGSSKLGLSVRRFEGREFIAETNNFIADKCGIHTGISLSDQKFSLNEDDMHLMAEITVTDSEYLRKPVTLNHRWKKSVDRDVVQALCT